jgi:CRP-like cAMP-binding protein
LTVNKDNLIRFIQSVLPMSAGKAELLAEKFKPGEIKKNGFLLKAGAVCNQTHFIEEGILRAYIYDLDGNDVTTDFFSKRMFASDALSFFKRTPSQEYIQALTDCETWCLTYEDMQENFHSIPEFREYGRQNIINNYSVLKQRMISMLQETAEQRYAGLISSHPEIIQNVPLKYIASYLGITDTSLSRIRKEFIKK